MPASRARAASISAVDEQPILRLTEAEQAEDDEDEDEGGDEEDDDDDEEEDDEDEDEDGTVRALVDSLEPAQRAHYGQVVWAQNWPCVVADPRDCLNSPAVRALLVTRKPPEFDVVRFLEWPSHEMFAVVRRSQEAPWEPATSQPARKQREAPAASVLR